MERLTNKRVLLGVSGGIAAYKSAELIRMLSKQGADVRVVMTKGACEFITPLTLQALSENPVHLDLLDAKAEAGMGHIELARWADVILVAPATANVISQLTSGQAGDLLTTLCLATSAPICIAPAMNQGMYLDETTQRNIQSLSEKGFLVFGPAEGSQACGDVGPGRMLEPEKLAEHVAEVFKHESLTGRKVLITGGPTQEAIDPVRYISNHSSGKMAFALAEAAVEAGARVTLVAGPVALTTPDRVERVDVLSAQEMHDAVHDNMDDVDIFIGCAAVCDYRPVSIMADKIKKNPDDPEESLEIKLVKNPDIVSSVADLESRPFVVGFAAETQNVLEYAAGKLRRKKLNLIVANDVSDKDIGFSSDDNEITLLGENFQKAMPRAAKTVLARNIIAVTAQSFDSWKKQ